MAAILKVEDLGVDFWVNDSWISAVESISYELNAGEVLAIVGESGSGKSQSSMIFQEPMTALNPVYTAGYQIVETLRVHKPIGPAEAKERALELMRLVDIPDPERRFDSYPHQLSGGQRQRIMIAQALACEPKLLIADEPTTALDVTVQAEILKLLRELRDKVDAGIILITHDMGVVADMADRIVVMRKGRVVETGTAEDIFARPEHPYTQELLAAVPHLGASIRSGEIEHTEEAPEDAVQVGGVFAGVTERAELDIDIDSNELFLHPSVSGPPPQTPAALELSGASIEYPKQGRSKAFRAAHAIDLRVEPGEVVGLVGESGSGKTTIGRAAVGLLPVVEGSLTVGGVELSGLSRRQLRAERRKVSMVFQDPGSSLNPRLPVGESIGEPLLLHEGLKGAALSSRVESLLDSVELPRDMRNRYPHELSGGQRQRIGIARALALEPQLLIADEPTSALDVSVQVRVLELFLQLQAERGFACLFISHDLAVIEMLTSKIAVMRHGHLVELGTPQEIVSTPRHPYTQRLIAAVPVPDPAEQRRRREAGDTLLELDAQDD